MLLQALDVANDRVLDHLSGFCKRTAVGDATRQSGHDSGESAFWFGTKRDFVVVVLSHRIGQMFPIGILREQDLASAPHLSHVAIPAFGGPVAS